MATLMLVAWPWTNQQITQLKARFEQRGDLQRVAPGQFQTSANGQRVFFVDKDSGSSAARQVFVSSTIDHIESTISAQSAQVKRDDNRQQLTLHHGQKLDRNTQTGIMTLSQFDQYDIEIGDKPLSDMGSAAPKNRWTWDLLRDPSHPAQAELGWRMGLVMCSLNLVLLAVAMTSGNPRSGRSGNLALAIFTFLLYMNLINLSQTWVEHGKLSATTSFIGLHGSIFAMGVLWLQKKQSNLQLKSIVKTLASRLRSAP
jgi:lipopolysaccharide export system permease protein